MYCNKCGNEIKEGQYFCTNCGAPVESLNQPVKVKKNKYVLPLCISLIAVVSVVGSVFVARNFYAFMGSRMRPAQIAAMRSPGTTTRESLNAATKTQCNQR